MRSPASGPRESATIIASSAAAERLSRSSLALPVTIFGLCFGKVKRPLSLEKGVHFTTPSQRTAPSPVSRASSAAASSVFLRFYRYEVTVDDRLQCTWMV